MEAGQVLRAERAEDGVLARARREVQVPEALSSVVVACLPLETFLESIKPLSDYGDDGMIDGLYPNGTTSTITCGPARVDLQRLAVDKVNWPEPPWVADCMVRGGTGAWWRVNGVRVSSDIACRGECEASSGVELKGR